MNTEKVKEVLSNVIDHLHIVDRFEGEKTVRKALQIIDKYKKLVEEIKGLEVPEKKSAYMEIRKLQRLKELVTKGDRK